MNETLIVETFYNCDQLSVYEETDDINTPMWRQTITVCNILEILKDMYKFNVSFVYVKNEKNALEQQNRTIDLYLRPMGIGIKQIVNMSPLYPLDVTSFGFILRRRDYSRYATFYSKPFTRPAWNFLYGMAFFASILFYFLKRWEMVIKGGRECSYAYEILMVIGAYCQHIPPIDAKILSRRIAYFVFFMFAYVIYTYYTSNLLSHLVSDKEHNLKDLPKTDLKIAFVDYIRNFRGPENITKYKHNYSSMFSGMHRIKPVTVTQGLEEVKAGKMALLSDYTSLYPMIKKSFTGEEICEISKIDVASNIKRYFYSSKQFQYKEQFKIGALRAKETGIMNRLTSKETDSPICETTYLVQTMFIQISIPITILFVTFLISICIMIMEKIHYERNKVWPYVD